MQKETWVKISGFDYMVSDLSRVKSNRRIVNRRGNTTRIVPEKVLTQCLQSQGYMVVGMSNEGVSKKARVHILVATAFVPNPLNLPEVNHKDGNKLNNLPPNLEWCTRSDNLKHAYRTGLKPSPKGCLGMKITKRPKNG